MLLWARTIQTGQLFCVARAFWWPRKPKLCQSEKTVNHRVPPKNKIQYRTKTHIQHTHAHARTHAHTLSPYHSSRCHFARHGLTRRAYSGGDLHRWTAQAQQLKQG